MNGALVDTSFWYALFDASDGRHADAIRIREHEMMRPFITVPCLAELVTLLCRKRFPAEAVRIWEGMRSGAYATVIDVTPDDESAGRAVMLAFDRFRLSFADATLCSVARRLDLPRVLAFDHELAVILRERDVVGPGPVVGTP
jgi:predicted nucleic acid-binding protein